MAGHSQFKNIMHRKGAQDKLRSKIFAKLAREIMVAVKLGGPDPKANARLRGVIANAKAQKLPKDNIERAINKGSGNDGANYEEVRYEGYGPANIAFVVEALTDNRARTAPSLRSIFAKSGGAMGDTGSVAFNFNRVGLITYPKATTDDDSMMEAGIEAGADDVQSSDEEHEIICQVEDFGAVRSFLEEKFGDPERSALEWIPNAPVTLNEEQAKSVLDFVEKLNDDDDVQNVFGNYVIPDEVMEKLG